MTRLMMNSGNVQRFPIRFDSWYAALSRLLLMPPSGSYVEVEGEEVRVRMAWWFRARFPKEAVASVTQSRTWVISRGVHGFAGRWLVNGSARGLMTIDLVPVQRAYVMGFPVRLRQLTLSMADPAGLAAALGFAV